jgi:hypothetical protein
MPPQSIGTEAVTGLIEIERLIEFERNLIPCLERLARVRERYERMGRELEVNVILIAEMLDPVHLSAWSQTIPGRNTDMLGP